MSLDLKKRIDNISGGYANKVKSEQGEVLSQKVLLGGENVKGGGHGHTKNFESCGQTVLMKADRLIEN